MWLSNGTARHVGAVWRDISHNSSTPTATVTTTTADQTPKAHQKSKKQDFNFSLFNSSTLQVLNEVVTLTLQGGRYVMDFDSKYLTLPSDFQIEPKLLRIAFSLETERKKAYFLVNAHACFSRASFARKSVSDKEKEKEEQDKKSPFF